MRVVAIGGVPASGKTTVIRELIRVLGERGLPERAGWLAWERFPGNKLIVVGRYTGERGDGTDRLRHPMIWKSAPEVFLIWARDPELSEYRVLFEGDKLFSSGFLNRVAAIKGVFLTVLFLDVSTQTLASRRDTPHRASQGSVWLRGRETKLRNLRANEAFHKVFMPNDTEGDSADIVEFLRRGRVESAVCQER